MRYIDMNESTLPLIVNNIEYIAIGTTTKCNLKCCMCSHGIPMAIKGVNMSEEVLEASSGACALCSSVVDMTGTGEPTMNNNLVKYIYRYKRIGNLNAHFRITTNAVRFSNRDYAMELIDAGLFNIGISLESATEETCRFLRGASLKKILKGIDNIVYARSVLNQEKTLSLGINAVLSCHNIAQLPDLVRLTHKVGVETLQLTPLGHRNATYTINRNGKIFDYCSSTLNNVPDAGRYLTEAAYVAKECGLRIDANWQLLSLVNDPSTFETNWSDGSYISESNAVHLQPKDCRYLWEMSLISPDGTITPCCFGGKSPGRIGKNVAFYDVWNGNIMQESRENIKNNEIPAICKNGTCAYVAGAR